jgi:hypothetical protein
MEPTTRKEIEAQASRPAYLIFKYLNESLTESEDEELALWMAQNEQNWKLFEEFTSDKFRKKFITSQNGDRTSES